MHDSSDKVMNVFGHEVVRELVHQMSSHLMFLWLPRLCQLFQPLVSCEFLSLAALKMLLHVYKYLKHLDILPNEYAPGNERMSPEKGPIHNERTVFQASFFRAHVSFFFGGE